MANIITLTIKTDDSYNETEKVELLDAFVEFITDMDPSVVEDSETISVIDEDDIPSGVSDEQKQEIVKEWLDEADFTGTVNVANGFAVEVNLTAK